MSDTETIDRLFLELSQFTTAKTKREVDLEQQLAAADDRYEYLDEQSKYFRNDANERIGDQDAEIARLAQRLEQAEAENERLTRWRDLAVAAATAGADQEVFTRFAESEAIMPIIQAWKDKVAQLEQQLAAAEALLREAVDAEWCEEHGCIHISEEASKGGVEMTRLEVAATVLFIWFAAVGFACQFMAALKIVHEWWWR